MVSSEVPSDRGDIIGILGTATCQTHGQSCRRAARATCRSKEGEEAAQEPSTALICSYTAQFLCGDPIYRATSGVCKNGNKKKANTYREFQLNIQVLCHLKCLCSCVQTNNDQLSNSC